MRSPSSASGLRSAFRLSLFLSACLGAGLDYIFYVRWHRTGQLAARARWTSRWARRMARCAGITIRSSGTFPTHGLLTCNHVSYMDIPVLASIHPQIFLSKSDVRDWPIIGWLTRCAGTLYIVRSDKSEVARVPQMFEPAVTQNLVVTLFPEGTSSDGRQVLPFYSSLLEPAVQNSWNVTPAWIEYEVEGGDACHDVAYWGNMTFLPHLINLCAQKQTLATVRFGTPIPPGLNRKELARELRSNVQTLGLLSDR